MKRLLPLKKLLSLKKTIWVSKLFAHLLLILTLNSCFIDFTPRIYQKILVAQDYIKNQDYKKAVKEYTQILDENPEPEIRLKIYYQLGEIFSTHLQEYSKAIQSFREVQSLTTDPIWSVKSEERIAEIYFTYIKNYRAAAKSYRKLGEFRPKLNQFDRYEYRLGLCFTNLEDDKRALKVFQNILKLPAHQFHNKAIYHVGIIYFHQQDWKKAIAYWTDYINRETNINEVIQVKFLMANAYETMEDLKTAYNIYYSILGDYPNTEVIQNRLKTIYERRLARKR